MNEKSRNLIKPTSFIGDKVPKQGGPTPAEAITEALKLTDDLISSYQGWAVDDLQKLWEDFRNGKGSVENVRALYTASHEIRGQGGSFGFPLITVVADSLCKFLEPRSGLGKLDVEVVKIHILAMKAVFAQKLEGTQAEIQSQLHYLLQKLREKA